MLTPDDLAAHLSLDVLKVSRLIFRKKILVLHRERALAQHFPHHANAEYAEHILHRAFGLGRGRGTRTPQAKIFQQKQQTTADRRPHVSCVCDTAARVFWQPHEFEI